MDPGWGSGFTKGTGWLEVPQWVQDKILGEFASSLQKMGFSTNYIAIMHSKRKQNK